MNQGKRLELRWFVIALAALVNLYYTISSTQGYFMAMLGLDDPLLSCIEICVMATALFLFPLVLKRRGILDHPMKRRMAFIIISAIGIAAFAVYGVMYRVERPDAIWPAIILQGIIGTACAVTAGCALQLAVRVISVKAAALLCGLTMVCMPVLTVLHLLFLGFIESSAHPVEYMAASYFLVYTVMLLLPALCLPVNRDEFTFTPPRAATYFNGGLYRKFIVLAVLIMLAGILSDGTYYADGNFENYFSEWFTFATMLLPIIGTCTYIWLLKKSQWLPAIAGMLLLVCFRQGLILFFDDRVQLAAAYGLAAALSGFGGTIFRLFIPMAFCIQKRENAHAAVGLTSAWMILNSIAIASRGSVSSVSPFITPAVTFVLSLVSITYLFYLYSENNRVTIAVLTAEFKAQDIGRVNEAVAKADRFEGLGLAPREKEVCVLLLKSLTVRQIAGELGLAFATVNGYYRSLYRKLNINSKAELFMRFAPDTQIATTHKGGIIAMAKFCTGCGAKLEERAKFCDICGHALMQEQPAAPQQLVEPAPGAKEKSKLPLILSIVGGIVVCAGAAFLLLRPKSDATPIAAATSTRTPFAAATASPPPSLLPMLTPAPPPTAAAQSVFDLMDNGTMHMDMEIVSTSGNSGEMELFQKDGKSAMLIKNSDMSARMIAIDGKFFMILDEYETVIVSAENPMETSPVEYGSSQVTYVGEGSGEFGGATYPYSEYIGINGEQMFYFMDGSVLKGIRSIVVSGNTTDCLVRTLDSNVPDDVFEWPASYTVQDETAEGAQEPWIGLWRYEDETGVEVILLGAGNEFLLESRLAGNELSAVGSYTISESSLSFDDYTVNGQPGEAVEFSLLLTGDTMILNETDLYIRVPDADALSVLADPLAPYTNPNDAR